MDPTRRQLVRALAGLGLTAPFARRATAAELPEGVPAGSVKATVLRYEDGDKYVVEIGTSPYTVLMISADAPERGDCFFHESSDHLRELLPRGTVVYLESDGELADKKKRLLRYTWKPRDGKKAQLIDERMIADGYARFKSRDGHTKRDSRLAKAQQTAKKEKRGFWAPGECGNPSATKPTAVPATRESTAPPLPYQVVSVEDDSFGGRARWSDRIVVEFAEGTPDQPVIATMVDALRNAFSTHAGADACIVFAFRPDTDPTGVLSLARAAASRDGRGWNGDGDLAGIGQDRGLAQIEIVDWDPTITFYTNPRTYEAAIF